MRRTGVGLPNTWQPGLYVEAIDASCSDLVYEGFNSLRNLIFLKVSDRGKSAKKRRAALKGNENISSYTVVSVDFCPFFNTPEPDGVDQLFVAVCQNKY